ncbi:MAG TPA: hypothetical protein VFW71_15725 [Actinomycetota bacterium]|nr:hypothetical protein [Actinomycetota bacterium]
MGHGGFPLASRIGHREHYYTVAAISLLHGHLDVPYSSLTFECFMRGHKCYGYFGITPTLLRLPVVALLGSHAKGLRWESLYFNLGFLVLAAGGWWISRQLVALWAPGLSRRANWVVGITASAPALGASPLLWLVARPLVYEEAILWGAAFASVAMGAAIALRSRPRAATIVVLVAADILATNARPTSGASALFATVVVGAWLFLRSRRAWGVLVLAGALVALVTPSVVDVAKFGHTSPPYAHQLLLGGNPKRIATFEHFAGLNPALLPTKVVSDLQPNALRLYSSSPYVGLAQDHPLRLWPARRGETVWEPTTSVEDALPLCFLLLVIALVMIARRARTWRRARGPDPALEAAAVLLVGALGALALFMMFPGETFRYFADWLPVFFVTDAVALAALARWLAGQRGRGRARAVIGLCVVLFAAQMFVEGSLAIQDALTSGFAKSAHCSGPLNPYGPVGTVFCPDSVFKGS